MSSIGDNIALLSYSTPLNSGASWVSSAVVLGQYNSLNVMIKTDQDTTLNVEWSGDSGINWDSSESYNIVAGVAKQLTLSTKQKNVRYRLENTSVSNQTYLRMTTYGVTSANSVVISDLNDVNVYITSDTQYGEVVTTIADILVDYVFYAGSPAVTTISNTLKTYYPDIYTMASASSNSNCGVDVTNRCLYLTSGTANAHGASIIGEQFKLPSASTLQYRLCVSFTYGSVTDTSLLVGFGTTGSNTTPTAFSSSVTGAYIGWKSAGAHTYDNFGFLVGSVFIPRTSFNVDKMSGDTFPILDLTQPNIFLIVATQMGHYSLYALNPNKRELQLLHVESTLNNIYRPQKPPTGLVLHAFNNATPSSECRVNLFGCKMLSDITREILKVPVNPIRITNTYLAGADRLVVSFRSLYTFQSSQDYSCILIDMLNLLSQGVAPIVVKIYLDGDITGGAWSQPNPYLPIEINTTGTFTPSDKVVQIVNLLGNDNKTIKYPKSATFINSYRYTTIVASSSNDFSLTTNFDFHI